MQARPQAGGQRERFASRDSRSANPATAEGVRPVPVLGWRPCQRPSSRRNCSRSKRPTRGSSTWRPRVARATRATRRSSPGPGRGCRSVSAPCGHDVPGSGPRRRDIAASRASSDAAGKKDEREEASSGNRVGTGLIVSPARPSIRTRDEREASCSQWCHGSGEPDSAGRKPSRARTRRLAASLSGKP
jgi:hypothetical protein